MSSDAREGAEVETTEARWKDFEGGPIIGRAELTEEDFKAVWAILPRNRLALVKLVFSLLAIPLFWLMIAVLEAHGWRGLMSFPVVIGSFVVGAVLAFGLWRRRFAWARSAAMQMRSAEGVELRFDSAGVSVSGQGQPFQHAWSSLYRCIETPRLFAIYTAPTMVMVVPKRAFAADEQVRLRAWLLKHVPKRELPEARLWRALGRQIFLWLVFLCAFLAVWFFLNQI
ncbi:MAG TPA: YcxB family protein [Polyangiaceae bacterium]|nr:YcxB family protein [Polyangiaceae bacterium]